MLSILVKASISAPSFKFLMSLTHQELTARCLSLMSQESIGDVQQHNEIAHAVS